MYNIVHNCDCMDYMPTVPDKFYDLANVDPQTGQGEDGGKDRRGIVHKKKNWDKERMPKKWIDELLRISKNQIIWQGGFYIEFLYSTSCWIVWDKKLDNCNFGDFELAWISFDVAKKIYRLNKVGGRSYKGRFIHPCQKPIKLYKWQLRDFAKPGWKIFDSHVGSGSIRIACHDLGFDFTGCEIDMDYWQAQEDRYQNYISQPEIFSKQEIQENISGESKMERIELFNDHFQNFKKYGIPKAQLVIADIPFNIGKNAYGSNPMWYIDGDNKKGESEYAKKEFFDTDKDFRIPEYFHFCNRLVKKEPKQKGQAPCMIVFCSFEQQFMLIEYAKKYGFPNYINFVFYKNYSAQVLKANMRIVGNSEYALLFYRNKLPKYNNNGNMFFNVMPYPRDNITPKIHPTQKPIQLLELFIQLFTDIDDVVIDPVAGSAVTLLAAKNLGRKAYGFEIKKNFYKDAIEKVLTSGNDSLFNNREESKIIFEEKKLD